MTAVKETYELTDYEELLIKEGKEEGEAIGTQKGKIEGEFKTLQNKSIKLLTKKLGSIPIDLEEKIKVCTNIEKLDQILDNIFDIVSFDEIRKILE